MIFFVGVSPWPILNGLDIQPKLSSPKKLLVSPRKTPTHNQSAAISGLASVSSKIYQYTMQKEYSHWNVNIANLASNKCTEFKF